MFEAVLQRAGLVVAQAGGGEFEWHAGLTCRSKRVFNLSSTKQKSGHPASKQG
jgi:hypothetical protein